MQNKFKNPKKALKIKNAKYAKKAKENFLFEFSVL
jgi:hypothetical protein